MCHEAGMHHGAIYGLVGQLSGFLGTFRTRLCPAFFLFLRRNCLQHVPPLLRPAMFFRIFFKALRHLLPTPVADSQGCLAMLAEMSIFHHSRDLLKLSRDSGPVAK